MTANILTPLMLWDSFRLEKNPTTKVVSTKQNTEITVQKFYIDGKTTETGTVKIYGVSAKPKDEVSLPAIIAFTDGNLNEEKLASLIAKNGYYAFVVNLYGKKSDTKRHTLYPDDISYANFEESKDSLQSVKVDVKHTCWYEWSVCARYVFDAVKNTEGVCKIGAFGVKEFATCVWHLAATEKLDCMATIFGFGWETYRGCFKFGDGNELKLSDENLMFVAGIEPESYAMHVKCPTLILTSTNHSLCDADRAHDTVSKIKDDVFRAVDYSVNFENTLSSAEFKNLKIFFDGILKDGRVSPCAVKAELHTEIKLGKLYFELNCEPECVDKAELYVSEETVNPDKRCWKRINFSAVQGGKYTVEYLPYEQSGRGRFRPGKDMGSGHNGGLERGRCKGRRQRIHADEPSV